MKPSELRAMGISELRRRLDENCRELFDLRFRMATRQLVKISEIRRVRKEIARIRTLLREKELGHAG
ncbi:MAG: 50S ribosomal protein L29 [Dehalococcoidia bacterium]|nr:50S ribosomal protein L29 [Dehalococcoidia bacterium]MDP7240725.1 50S ribosomal protein L29 [Dehalococcoidia bacterium]MDP7470352.1 50S ribosomal protein L29 [Dehalococcoidia bacterium]